ncbi:helix-turn-helix domain-containing protein [Amycolatopsis pithecellobii]|uniref:PucR C-terminal helix-turn-helix domain-containing protein n=1 Tax=Amycolatopsis pithecellobii TaxID=664692 RepID=A0A6N7YP04_9PSEU|nr:helix-turn-helix domain-containing protein [Amycolatopsis pithecellobii]MTD54737.1 hypothetical protein [Amycolatopsis pithecellobii]
MPVITGFFDTQLFEGTSLDRLIERSAFFTRAAVGRITEDGRGVARNERGSLMPATQPPTASSHRVPGTGGWVWVDRVPEPAVQYFLDRLAATVSIIERWGASLTNTTTSPISVLVDRSSSEIAQELALSQLGIARDTAIRVVLCDGPGAGVEHLADTIAKRRRVVARTNRQGKTILLLVANDADDLAVPGVPVDVRVAYSKVVPAARTHDAYVNAHDAYLFSRPSLHDLGPYQPIEGVLIDGSRLAGLSALCRLSHEDIEIVPEIGTLDMLAEQHGEQILPILYAYAITGSLRKAANQLYLHHNSVAYWVRKAEAELGYSLAEPNRRAQFFITVCLYRLWKENHRLHSVGIEG